MNSKQMAAVMHMLSRRATVADISKSAGVTRQTLYRALRSLADARVARIDEWRRDRAGRAVEPVWALGDAPHCPRGGLTSAERQRQYRQRKKNNKPAASQQVQQEARKE